MKRNTSDIIKNVLLVRRVVKVVKGGRRASFSFLIVAGNKRGEIGLGKSSAHNTMDAFKKASNQAIKNMSLVPLFERRTLKKDVYAKMTSTKVFIKKCKEGQGIISGPVGKIIFKTLGLKDVNCKIIGSSNPINVAYTIFKALNSQN